ncbi:MAG: hypothetical protein IKU40_10425 [Clostridia bacterium]|nr:hypothetical protein [Clostridia bacterium]
MNEEPKVSTESSIVTSGNLQYSIGSLELGLRNTFDPKQILNSLLHDAVEYYGADRAYILEADWHLGIFTNTYEVCREGIPSQSPLLQSIPFEKIKCMEKALERNVPIVLSDAERIEKQKPEEYEFLKSLDIQRLIGAPMRKTYNSGFLCVDNPTRFTDEPDYLLLLAYVAISELNEITLREMVETYRRNIPTREVNDVSINCLGRFEIITPKGTLCEEDFSSDLICAFFSYLVITKKKISSSREIINTVWEESAQGDPYLQVKNAANRLRNILKRIEMESLVIPYHGTFILNPEFHVYTDLERLENVCKRMMGENDMTVLDGLYHDADTLYMGNLIPRIDYYHWLIPYSVHYDNLYLQAITRYIQILMKYQRYSEVQQVVVDNIAFFPQGNTMHYHLIWSLICQKNEYYANQQYQNSMEYLTDEQKEELTAYLGRE